MEENYRNNDKKLQDPSNNIRKLENYKKFAFQRTF